VGDILLVVVMVCSDFGYDLEVRLRSGNVSLAVRDRSVERV
jgi:hypothetical protein